MISKNDFYGYEEYTLQSDTLTVKVITLGATVTDIEFAGRKVCLGYDTAQEYLDGGAFIGAIIGRYANRIGGSAFELNGVKYELPANEGKNQLHGGPRSYDKRRWNAEVCGDSVKMTLFSPDGDNAYPGNLTAGVTYTVSGGDLRIDFEGICDKDTVYAPTTHMYFNLDGGNVLDHSAHINASGWLEPDEGLIPTGRILPADGAFDFSETKTVGRNFDHCFVLQGEDACRFSAGGISVSLTTDFPALQFYTGSSLSGAFGPNDGFAIEPEFYPDTPNHPEFPSCVLKKDEKFHKFAIYSFEKD